MTAESYGFALLKRKRPAPSLLVFRLGRHPSNVLRAHPLNARIKQRWCWDDARILFLTFDGLSSVWLLFTNSLTQLSRFEVLLTADSQCFTRNDSRTYVLTVPRRRRVFTGWNIEVFVYSSSASSVVIFLPPAYPPLVSSPNQSPPSFPAPSLSTGWNHPLLDHRRRESHQTYSSYQLVSHL